MWVQATHPPSRPPASMNTGLANKTLCTEDLMESEEAKPSPSYENGKNINEEGEKIFREEEAVEQLRRVMSSIEQQARVVKEQQMSLLEMIEERTQLEAKLTRLTSRPLSNDDESLNATPAASQQRLHRTSSKHTLYATTATERRSQRKSVDASTTGYLLKSNLFSQLFASSSGLAISNEKLSSSPPPTSLSASSPSLSTLPTEVSPSSSNNKDKQPRRNRIPSTKQKKKYKSNDVFISRDSDSISNNNTTTMPVAATTPLIYASSSLPQLSAFQFKKEETLEERRERTRKSVLKEIYSTETDYVKDLSVLYQVYYKEVFKGRIELGIQDGEIRTLFKAEEIIKMIECNSSFLSRLLVDEEYNNDQSHIGELFKSEIPSMRRVYVEYCSRQSEALDVLRHIRKKPSVASFLEKLRTNHVCHALDIESFLIKPMQRICRYPLLLKELLKQTPPKHDDFKNIKEAILLIEELAKEINETKRVYEDNMNKLSLLQSQLIDTDDNKIKIAAPQRSIISTGCLKEIKTGGKIVKRTVWILNDLILIGSKVFSSKSGSKKISIRRALPLVASFSVRDDLDSTPDLAKGQKHCFSIVNSSKHLLIAIFVSDNKQDKDDWIAKFRIAISGAPPHPSHSDELVKCVEAMKNKDQKETRLHIAAANNNVEQMNTLLGYLFEIENINRKDRSGLTPLMIASNKRHWEIALLLLSIPQCNVSVPTLNDRNTVLHLLLKRAPQDLEELVQYRSVLQRVVDKGADINAMNANGDTPLHIACINNSIHGVHFLVKNNVKLIAFNKQGDTPISCARKQKYQHLVEFLESFPMETEFHSAVKGGEEMQVISLLSNKIEVSENLNRQDSNGWSPVMLSAACGNLRLCKLFLEFKSCNVTSVNCEGNSLLHILAKHNIHSAPVTSEESVDYTHSQHMKPIDIDLYREILRVTLDRGADINLQNNLGDTPLHVACASINIEGVRFFIANNALTSLPNKTQQTALQYGEQNDKIGPLFRSFSASS